MEYIYQFDICAVCLTAVLGIVYLLRRNFPIKSNKIFFLMNGAGFCAALYDLISVFTISAADYVPLWLNYTVSILYLFAYNSAAVLYTYYIIIITCDEKVRRPEQIMLISCTAVELLLLLTTPFTKLMFYFDSDNNYMHGDLFILLYVISFALLIYALFKVLKYHKKLTRAQTIPIVFFNIAIFFAIAFQMIFTEVLITNFVVSLYLLLVFISLQHPDYYLDKSTDLFNLTAFEHSLKYHAREKRELTYAVFTLEGYTYIKRMVGKDACRELVSDAAKQLRSLFGKRSIYMIGECTFVVQLDKTDETEAVINLIQQNFTRHSEFQQAGVMISPLICIVKYPDFFKSSAEVIEAINYLFTSMANTEERVVYASAESLEKMYRESEIIFIIKRAINNDELQVWYQPILDVMAGKFYSAEALVRLFDDKLGSISPEVFIPIAEKNGLIVALGEQVFRKVCVFLKTSRALELGVKYIEVNLSGIQCVQDNLASLMLDIMKEYDISPSMINFEVTETAAAVDEDLLRKNMRQLVESGSTFSMDDYGTGFSTANHLISLPFDIVKIDKSILWPAMGDKKAFTILLYTVRMLKALKKHIVVEGVETQEMADTLSEMNIDYFQGYLYSKPINGESYIKFLEEHNLEEDDN